MSRSLLLLAYLLLVVSACRDDEGPVNPFADCILNLEVADISTRNFAMGFSSWLYGPTTADRTATYDFIENNGDVYSEQLDGLIPWEAWMNGADLPAAFIDDLNFRRSAAPDGLPQLISVSLLNEARNDLIRDISGAVPEYVELNDQHIEDAYFLHLEYLINFFEPDAIVLAMEVNELLANTPEKWEAYQQLMVNIRSRIRVAFPSLPQAESVSLHRWFAPEENDPPGYQEAIATHVQQSDFVAISFYPFLRNWHSRIEFQAAFDFLHEQVDLPIAFVETSHLAEDLRIESLDFTITSDECEQQNYLETLLINAQRESYPFIIWWAHRDYDALLEIFPPEFYELGSLFKDTGLLKEGGEERSALSLWRWVLSRR